ncbi:hypothetical protein [Streptomyces sp. NBC_01285]|nr:hypothetical protein [Streptomyces sp. NBC_01285]MCX4774838.1 hypothetical protein [Streptomyces sp. NBC_01285]
MLTADVPRAAGATVGLAAIGGSALFQEVRARTPQTYFTDAH